MSLRTRVTLLLSFLLAGFVAALLWRNQIQRATAGEMLANERATRTQLLGHWIELAGRALPQFTADTAQSEEFAKLLAQLPETSAHTRLARALAAAGADQLWVLREDGTVRVEVAASAETRSAFPLAPPDVTAVIAETPSPRFFAEAGRQLAEICLRRIPGAAHEWLAVGRVWNERQLRALSQLTESAVTLRGPEALAHAPASGTRLVLVRPLADWRGRVLRVLHIEQEAGEPAHALHADWQQAQVFIVFGLFLLVAVALALRRWVLHPLGLIGRSLAQHEPATIAPLAQEKTEFGQLARIVQRSFAHRAELEQEIAERQRAQLALEKSEAALRANLEERSRLGRDLHDGVIQSLYAAGMGLAGIRSLLRPEQTEAAVRLEQSRAALNETIHDVRNFIIGLEPESLKLQTFSQAVSALLDIMQSMGKFESTVEIDEQLAARLSLTERVHAL